MHNTTNNADIDAPEAWDIFTGSDSIVVAVLDSGIAYNHPDLNDNMWNGNTNHGWDFFNNDSDPIDDNGHGTHVAGTIGAEGNNGLGVTGVNWDVKLMALKVGNYAGNVGDIADAIDFAISNDVKIINASFGGSVYSQAEFDAIDRFRQAGGIFIAAAGNGGPDHIGDNNDSNPQYPADYALDNIISVAATDQNDDLASFSNYGNASVDVGAPGVNIYSTMAGSNIFSEDFESSPYKFIPKGFTTPNWIVGNNGSSYVAYSDKYTPYDSDAYTWLELSNSIDLSDSEISGATLNFTIWCDTPPAPIVWQDYIQTAYYNGVWNNAERYDEDKIKLDGGSAWTDSGYDGYYKIYSEDISNYLSNDFKFSFDWHTDSSVDNNLGCIIDDIKITKYTNDTVERYDYMQGTSMATPHVAGLAALIWGYDSGLSIEQVKDAIINTGDDLPAGSKEKINGGTGKRINAFNALNSLTDSTPPIRSNPLPTGELSSDTTETLISLETDENATCKYSTTENTEYSSMTDNFSTTGETTHSTNVTGLEDGQSYNYYVRCEDETENLNTDDFAISFSVAEVVNAPPVITLTGENQIDLFVGDSYTDDGATALDDIDGDITEDIVVGGDTVDTIIAGTYIITYNVSDSVGNSADEVTRTINVEEVILESIEITNSATKLIYTVGDELDITDLEVTGTYNNNSTSTEEITIDNITGFNSSTPVDDQILTITVSEKTATYTIDIISVPDATPPILTEEISVSTPTKDNTPNYTFNSDEAGAIAYDGGCLSATDIASEGNNTITFNELSDGTYSNCTIIVTDASDNISNTLIVSSFIVDTTNPTAEETTAVTTPTNDITPDVGITVESGADWEIKNGDISLNTGTGTETKQTITLAELGEGTYNLTLIATDEAENTTTINLSEFTIDLSVSPINLSTLPNNPTNQTTADITVSGSDIAFYKYKLDTADYSDEIDIDTNIVLLGLSEGEHTISVMGRDEVGNWSDEILETWTVDLTPPNSPVITDPAGIIIVNDETYSIAGTAEDNSLVEIYSGTVLVGSKQLGVGETAYSIEVNLTQNADNNFTATATDLAGNESASATVPTITEDSIAPVVIITSPADGLITNQDTITVVWIVDEAESSEEVTLIEGENVLTKEATDDAENTGSDSITVILDTIKPVITLIGSTTINLYIGDTYEELGATAEDNVSDAITIDSNDVDTSVADTYKVTYNVSDDAGNEADEVMRTVIVNADTTPSVRSNGLPTGTLVVGTTETTLSLTTDENATCRYATATGTEYGAMTEIFNTTSLTDHSTLVTGLTNGNSYTYYIRCQDDSNNSNADNYEISFSVASPAPPNGGGGGGGSYTPPSSISSINNPLKISSIQEGTLTQDLNNKNKVKVEIPKGSIKYTTTFTASEGSLEEGDIPKDKIGAFLFNGLVFNINAVDTSKKAVREFSEDLTITLTIPDLPEDISALELYYFDDENNGWIIITGVVFSDGTISFKVNHLTQFAVFKINKTKESKEEKVVVLGIEANYREIQLQQILTDANNVWVGDVNSVIANSGVKRDLAKEADGANKYTQPSTKGIAGLTAENKNAITNFVVYGTNSTQILGAGERAGVINSYKSAFGKLPTTQSEWEDVIKIANGRWPSETNSATEEKAKTEFKKVYLREPDMNNPNDNAAVTVIAYGLRPSDRNLDSEKAGIKIFKGIYSYNPTSATDWDIARAIAYSGAAR